MPFLCFRIVLMHSVADELTAHAMMSNTCVYYCAEIIPKKGLDGREKTDGKIRL